MFVLFSAGVCGRCGMVCRRFVFQQVREWRLGSACKREELEPHRRAYVSIHVLSAFSVRGDMCRDAHKLACGVLVE